MMSFPDAVVIEEQGLRDGLQSEPTLVPTERKLHLIEELIQAGVRRIQVTSFVHPKLVPQMADAEDLCAALQPRPGVLYTGLVLNTKGMERAAAVGLDHVSVSLSASETHSRNNARLSLREARDQFRAMVRFAKSHGLTVRGGVQCAFGCRFEGAVPMALVLDLVKEQLDQQVDEIALADSTGMGHPGAIQELCGRVLELAGERPLFLHLHDTEGKGLANVLAALNVGVRYFDAAFGGLGGCPFIKGASGNIATEDLLWMLRQMGIRTGIDVARIAALSRSLEAFLGRIFPGKMHRLLERRDIQLVGA